MVMKVLQLATNYHTNKNTIIYYNIFYKLYLYTIFKHTLYYYKHHHL